MIESPPTPSVIDPYLVANDPLDEIKSKVDFWHERMQSQLSRLNTYADYWRLLKPARPADLSGFANPQSTETTRATEAMATFFYRAMTSANPNFQLVSSNPMTTEDSLWVSEKVIEWQKQVTQYNRKLMKGCRAAALFGTSPVEEPWVTTSRWEGTDFVPRSMLQMAFDPMVYDIALSPWLASLDFVTESQIRKLGLDSPGVYDQQAIEDSLGASAEVKNLPQEVQARLTGGGYMNYGGGKSHIYQLTTYHGILNDDKGMRLWTISTVNDIRTIRGHVSSYQRPPFTFGHINEFELEPIAYGVGRIAECLQPEINSNRGRMHDTITFSLFNQWLASRMANIKTSQLKIKPWGVVEVDGDVEKALKAIRPQLEGVNYGIQMDTLMKSEFRATSGASDVLQAMVTEATATESSLAQSEAVRRLSVLAELLSESFVREHIAKMHENNLAFLDQPFNVAVAGEDNPLRVFPNSLAQDASVITKIVTDKDFRPQRNKDLLQFLQVITSIRSQNPQLQMVDLKPFVEEFARSLGMNPKKVWNQMAPVMAPMIEQGTPTMPGGIPSAMDRMGASAEGMESLKSNPATTGALAYSNAQDQLAQAGAA